jgi:IS30 family transposase
VHVRRYSTRELARSFGLNVETVRREIRRGHLKASLGGYGRYQVVYANDLDAWLENMGKKVLARSLHRIPRSPRNHVQCDTAIMGDPTEAIQGKPRPRKNKP